MKTPITRKVISGIRNRPALAAGVYVTLLILSNITQMLAPREWYMLPADNRISTEIPKLDRQGPVEGDAVTISALEYGASGNQGTVTDDRLPVILIHGSPGQSTDFTALGPELAARDRHAYALDMPGFGMSSGWVPDYSGRAYARAALAFMDANDIQRAHIVGWSNGGAVAFNAADIAPDRLASITLLAAIACQETEGTGDFYFEHAKYAVGYGAVVVVPELIPHFGLLFPREYRHAFIRNFWDTDQRPIRGIMESLEIPTLILHGRHDPLVSDHAAERHHELIPTSRLVMTEHSHFLPFMQPALTADYLEEHFVRHDTPGIAPLTDALILEPPMGALWFRGLINGVRAVWWPLQIALVLSLATCRRETTTAIVGLLVGHSALDFGVAFVGLFAGRLISPRSSAAPRRTAGSVIATLLWSAISLLIAQILLGSPTRVGEANPFAVIASVLGVALLLHILRHLPSRGGRRALVISVRRFLHHEWWPNWLLYAPITPHLLRLAIRHRSLTVWTCVNPGITPGGGIAGESKDEILRGLDPTCALTQIRLDDADQENPAVRARRAHERITAHPSLGYPIVIKPEAGERGAGVAIVRTQTDLPAALAAIPGVALAQRYHPGPTELGVFWVRNASTVGDERTDAPQGSVLGVTRKILPELICDGERTLREQILAHTRFRMQAPVYFEHRAARLDEIPPAGTPVRLTDVGNHARGARFEDAKDLITPEFSEAIDRMARTWRGPNSEPFDYGRFDIRCASDDCARAGDDLAVIELNGVTSEATNLYDPSWSPFRALKLLAEQWTHAFELGAARRRLGSKPLGVTGIVRALRDARR